MKAFVSEIDKFQKRLFSVISKGFLKQFEVKTNGKNTQHFDRSLVIIKLKVKIKNFA